jgi:hypothetical protein
MDNKLRVKYQRYFKAFLREFFSEILAPLDRNAFLVVVAAPLSAGLYFYYFGITAMDHHLGALLIGFYSFVGAYVAYILLCIIRSPFVAYQRESNKGYWEGAAFIYKQPLLVFTKRLTVEENNKPFTFHVDDPEPNTFVRYKIDVENAEDRVLASIDFAHGKNLESMLSWSTLRGIGPGGGIRLPNDKALSLVACLKENTVPVTIRVYIKSFEIQ